MKSKHIAILAWITFIASMVTGVKGYNDNLGIGLFFLTIVLVIVSIVVEVKSPEYKARVAENLARQEKRREERKAKRAEENRYETPWIDVEILDYHEGWKKSYLMYAATYRDGTVKTHKSDIRFFIGEYNLNKIIAVEHIGNASKGVLRFFASSKPLFIVTYYDGSKAIIGARENSKNYMELLSFVGKSEEEIRARTGGYTKKEHKTEKQDWRKDYYASGAKFGINPDDYETETDFALAMNEAIEKMVKKSYSNGDCSSQNETDQKVYTYCGVTLTGSNSIYYYRTEDETLCIGDKVVVPAGPDNKETVGEIVTVEKHRRKTAPYPVERTKSILRKVDE